MGASPSTPIDEKKQLPTTVGATAPAVADQGKPNLENPPVLSGGRRKTRSRKARKSRKGKRHSRR